MSAKVSVIMGIYNCAGTLCEAIDSVLAQTFTDWELIMCDDGSTDNTFEIAMQYSEKYPDKFVLLRNEQNMGLNHTLNRCLEKAQGEYIARMDADDISLPERFETEVDYLDTHPEYAIVSTQMVFFDNDGDWGESHSIPEPAKKDFIRHSPVHCHAPCMIRSEALRSVNGYSEDKRTFRVEDMDLWFRLYARGYRGRNLEKSLYKMRDDRAAAARRSLRTRLNGAYVLFRGYKLMGFPAYTYGYIVIFVCLQIIKCAIPQSLYIKLRKKRLNKNQK